MSITESGASPLSSYIVDGRLADVLTLIQILAFDTAARRSAAAIQEQLDSQPLSASTWQEFAKQHPEFFRVYTDKETLKTSISLIARFALKPVPAEVGGQTPILDSDVTNDLMNLAVQLHDREIQRRDRWKTVLVPTILAFFTIAGFFFGVYQFYEQQRLQADALQREVKRENDTRERELTKRLWEKRLEIYDEATSAASKLATTTDQKEKAKKFYSFLEIYNGKLPLVWDSDTCNSAKQFRDLY